MQAAKPEHPQQSAQRRQGLSKACQLPEHLSLFPSQDQPEKANYAS